jgi:hypothetical protein
MSIAAQSELEPGRAYRTRDFERWGKNPTRLARRLVRDGTLREAARGIYYMPDKSRFGPVPATDETLLHAFLNNKPFVITGPPPLEFSRSWLDRDVRGDACL